MSPDNQILMLAVVQAGKAICEEQPDVKNGASIDIDFDLFDASIASKGLSSVSFSMPFQASATLFGSLQSNTSSIATTSTMTILPSTASVSVTGKANAGVVSSSSNDASGKNVNKGNDALSRGAAAGIGITVGLLGVCAIVYLAILARKRLVNKRNGTVDSWEKMRETSEIKQAQDTSYRPVPSAAESALFATITHPKKSKSVRSYRSWKTHTPRSSAWYAANPKKSADLSALPQKTWD